MIKGRKINPFNLTDEGQHTFNILRQYFMQAPLLQHFDPKKISRVETNVSKSGITDILSQLINKHDNNRRIT
jgi:hypothetical protein